MCINGICISLLLPKNVCVEYHPPYFIDGLQRRSPNKLMCSNLQRCRPIFANMHSCMLMHFTCYGLWHVLSEWCVASMPTISFKCPLAKRFSREESHCVDGVHSYRVNLIFLVEKVTGHQTLPYSIPFVTGSDPL